MKTKILALLLSALMIACMIPFAVVSADEGIAKSDNVVFVANAGSDENPGTLEAPVATLQKAVEKLQLNGGVAVIIGQVTISAYKDDTGANAGNSVMPPHNGTITVTSYYDGVDYRTKFYGTESTPARLILDNGTVCSFALQGDYVFDYLDICVNTSKKNCIIACYYNDVTFGANIKTVFEGIDGTPWYEGNFACDEYPAVDPRTYPPIILNGMNIEDAQGVGNMLEGATITEPATLNVAGGTWQSVRIGDRDCPFRNTVDCAMTMNISGGTYTQWTGKWTNANTNLCVMAHYQFISTENFVSTVNITGGIFHGEISGFGTFGSASFGDAIEEGIVNINIEGGSFQRYYTGDAQGICGPIVVASQYYPFMAANLQFGEKACVNIKIDSSKIAVESFDPYISVFGLEDMLPVYVDVTEKSDLVVISEDIPVWNIKYAGVPAGEKPAETEAPATTEAPKTEAPKTEAPKTEAPKTEAPKTEAPATQAPATQAPATQAPAEESSPALFIVLGVAAAVIVAVVVIIVIKKKKA